MVETAEATETASETALTASTQPPMVRKMKSIGTKEITMPDVENLKNASRLDIKTLSSLMQAKNHMAKCGWVEGVFVGSKNQRERVRKCSMIYGKHIYYEVYTKSEYEALVAEVYCYCKRPKHSEYQACQFFCKFCGKCFGQKNGLNFHRLMGPCTCQPLPLKMYPTVTSWLERTRITRKHHGFIQSVNFKVSSNKSNKRKGAPRAARTVAKRKKELILDLQSIENSDIVGSSGGSSSIRATQMIRSNKKTNEIGKDALHSIPMNGLYILCSETQEIIDDPELLKSLPSLMLTLHELEMKDQLYERIGSAYGVWLLAAPVERPRCEPELSNVRETGKFQEAI